MRLSPALVFWAVPGAGANRNFEDEDDDENEDDEDEDEKGNEDEDRELMEADNTNQALEILLSPPRRINLIGVAGSGMSGIAGLLLELGHIVSGSDRVSSVETRRLENLGLTFHLPQTPETVHGADLVIYSSAIKQGNP
ncbi:MAG TPA: Mur ligase domain-containing protein, partial [Chthoniobacterales bacterium]|nr:Mur ligase domain-containing protein [Chthoniobacterales bacterium]